MTQVFPRIENKQIGKRHLNKKTPIIGPKNKSVNYVFVKVTQNVEMTIVADSTVNIFEV